MTTGNKRTQFHLDSLSTLDEVETKLEILKGELVEKLEIFKYYLSNLAEEDRWNDVKHAEYIENYIVTLDQRLQTVTNTIDTECIQYIKRYRHKAEELVNLF